jgi:uncharacterized protein (TIGR03083 family)
MTVSGSPAGDVARLFAIERTRLLDVFRRCEDADWQRPTPCPEWTVLELGCHLVGDDLSTLARHRDGHHAPPPPPGGDEAEFIQWLDNLQAQWVRAARRLSPQLVIDLLRWSGPQIVDFFAVQDREALTGHVSWAGPDAVPVWLDQVRELSEYWIHRQQLLEALGQPSDLRPDLLAPVLDALRWAYPFRLRQVPATSGDTVSIVISGPVSVEWYLVSTGEQWEFRTEPGRAIASLSMTTDQAWRLLTNNLTPDRAVAMEMTGDEQVLDVLLQTRAIIGSPK